MDRVALDLGFIQIYWYSICIFLAMLTASILVFKEAKRKQIDEEFIINLIFDTIIIGVLGARAYYVIFNLEYYLVHPIEILEIWNGGLAIHGGIIAGSFFVYHYCKKHKVDIITMADIIAVGLMIAQAIGRWGNFFNCEAYGGVTTYDALVNAGIPKFVRDGMFILGEYRQPTFFYESIWCFFGFLAMIFIRKYDKVLKKGQLTGFYLIWYGVARLIIEAARSDSLMLGPLKIAQLISILFIVLGIKIFRKYNKSNAKEDLYEYIPPKEQKGVVYFK